ncbi:polysaccharide deacetylase family protein [uncultured Clostridium sp.]|jgi:peptidoglycan/xylan/chitin deacetylase (PgdA/CDA1 family)|uniref:polysaccharide deacetylase family protein n=1 Tax=uncultured Clostridium sp. TaxID=59620 RepID=UPI0026340186|nr:polysaccharide deacetylase family protein [uncultured Clostridium sp.]
MAKDKVVGIIVALAIAGGLAAGGYYYNDHIIIAKIQQDQVIQSNTLETSPASTKSTKTEVSTDKTETVSQQDVIKEDAAKKAEAIEVAKEKADAAQEKADKEKLAQVQKQKEEALAKVKADKEKVAQEAAAAVKAKEAQVTASKAKEEAKTDIKPTPKPAKPVVGPTNNEIVPNGNIIYSAKSYAVPANEVNEMVNGKYPGNEKEIFLTFDDGPSITNTPKVLKVLKEYGVHATFFVLGSELKTNADKNIIKDEIIQGNAVADHSYSHSYKILYPHNSVDVSTFMKEFNETNDIMRSVLGKNFNARIVRMPGGYMSRVYYHDKHLPALNAAFKKAGITSVDWNAETGDATGKYYTSNQLVQNAGKETKGYHHIVLLMHDIKSNTAAALPQLIQYYKSRGYEFKVISNTGIN